MARGVDAAIEAISISWLDMAPIQPQGMPKLRDELFSFSLGWLACHSELRIIALRAVASSFPDATPRRTAQDLKRITTLDRQPRLKKIVSISSFFIKAYNYVCELTGHSGNGYSSS
jgi:hypothetical protein